VSSKIDDRLLILSTVAIIFATDAQSKKPIVLQISERLAPHVAVVFATQDGSS
jgi:hypothetical protein